MRKERNLKAGFSLMEMMIVVLVIGTLASILLPSFFHARTVTKRNSCIGNLRQIDQAKDQLAMAKNLREGTEVKWSDITPIYIKQMPLCPSGGLYTLNPTNADPICSLAADGHLLTQP